MPGWLARHSNRSSYRITSIALYAVMAFLVVMLTHFGVWGFVTVLAIFPLFVTLIFLTANRLRDAGWSGAWVLLMLITLNVGPGWDPPGPIRFHWAGLITMIPMFIGWFAPSITPVSIRTEQNADQIVSKQ